MVRLVFRPYTQVRRSSCTLESLRPSTRVSPGFALLRHSSPSFGSRHRCSHSNLDALAKWSVDGAAEASNHHFHCALWFATTILAPVSDSLVRVSRRGKEHHFLSPHAHQSRSTFLRRTRTLRRPRAQNRGPEASTSTHEASTDDLWFHLSNFRHSLTLFSKFFSSFLHSTCSLSVSHPYLALDGIYHPL